MIQTYFEHVIQVELGRVKELAVKENRSGGWWDQTNY